MSDVFLCPWTVDCKLHEEFFPFRGVSWSFARFRIASTANFRYALSASWAHVVLDFWINNYLSFEEILTGVLTTILFKAVGSASDVSGKLCFGFFFTLLTVICKVRNSIVLVFTAVLPICDPYPSTKLVITPQSLVFGERNVYASHRKGTREVTWTRQTATLTFINLRYSGVLRVPVSVHAANGYLSCVEWN